MSRRSRPSVSDAAANGGRYSLRGPAVPVRVRQAAEVSDAVPSEPPQARPEPREAIPSPHGRIGQPLEGPRRVPGRSVSDVIEIDARPRSGLHAAPVTTPVRAPVRSRPPQG